MSFGAVTDTSGNPSVAWPAANAPEAAHTIDIASKVSASPSVARILRSRSADALSAAPAAMIDQKRAYQGAGAIVADRLTPARSRRRCAGFRRCLQRALDIDWNDTGSLHSEIQQ